MRALPPRNPNETQPSFVGQISRVRPMLAPARFAWTCDAEPAAGAAHVGDEHRLLHRQVDVERTHTRRERSQRRERDLRRGVRVRGIARAAHGRTVGIARAVEIARRRPSPRGRTPATTNAGRSIRTASRTPTPTASCRQRVVARLRSRRRPCSHRPSKHRARPGCRAAMAVGLDSTRSATDTPSRREPDTRVRLRSRACRASESCPPTPTSSSRPTSGRRGCRRRSRTRRRSSSKDTDGGDAWLFAGVTRARSDRPRHDARACRGTSSGGPASPTRRPAPVATTARRALADMDIDGVDAEMLFPPQRTIGHFLGDEDDDFVRAGIDAYNNFLWEEFCAPDRSRLIGMAQIPSTGVDDAVDTLRKAKARGFKTVVISCWPSGGDGISRRRRSVLGRGRGRGDAGVHPHQPHLPRRTAAHAAARQGRQAQPLYGSATTRSRRPTRRRSAAWPVCSRRCPAPIGQLIFTGVFERFPNLHIPLIETGVGWLPHFLEQMDDRYWRNRSWGNIPISEPPSFYWYSQHVGHVHPRPTTASPTATRSASTT